MLPIYLAELPAVIAASPSEHLTLSPRPASLTAATRSASSFEIGATRPHCHSAAVPHGLRKAACRRLAELDAARTRSWRSADTQR
jgi:hypothetical protein